MIEVVALMIGEIVQCYSEERYEAPGPRRPECSSKKGLSKSLYRPGSSTDVLLFQKGRVQFADDLVRNLSTPGAQSRFSSGFGRPLVETEVMVRSLIARCLHNDEQDLARSLDMTILGQPPDLPGFGQGVQKTERSSDILC